MTREVAEIKARRFVNALDGDGTWDAMTTDERRLYVNAMLASDGEVITGTSMYTLAIKRALRAFGLPAEVVFDPNNRRTREHRVAIVNALRQFTPDGRRMTYDAISKHIGTPAGSVAKLAHMANTSPYYEGEIQRLAMTAMHEPEAVTA